jgi:flagellar protein FlaJ
MGFYTKVAMRLFLPLSTSLSSYFTETKNDLKRARIKLSLQEYVCISILTSLVVFVFELPLLSFIFSLVFGGFLFGLITAFTVSLFLTIVFFMLFLNYPKVIVKSRAKELDRSLPFASLYLSTIAGSKLPLHKVLTMFSKFSKHGELTEEVNAIVKDMEMFGFDVNTALERAIERTPSKNFKELLWGILSTSKSGGDVDIYLKEKAKTFIDEYRRELYEFSHKLTVFIEVYLTAIVLGAVFFTILTSIMSGVAGVTGDIIMLQFLLIFVFLPILSMMFIILIRSVTPGGE